ncbi:MAG: DMT family transporter [Legionellales bacterium]|nr:DMT family transporter [Legionellales bacterium]
MMSRRFIAYCSLIFITMIWGLTFPIINLATPHISASLFVCLRFLLATLFALPLFLNKKPPLSPTLLFQALILGMLTMLAYYSQTLGLRTIDPAVSAFITSINVILVPLIAPLFGYRKPSLGTFYCGVLCLVGVYFLTGASINHFSFGMVWTVLCAVFYSVYLLSLQRISASTTQPEVLAFLQLLFTGIMAGFLLPFHPLFITLNHAVIIALLFCSFFASTVVFVLQTRYQRYIPPQQVALMFALEPIFASIASYWLAHEYFNWHFYVGSILIFFSIIATEIKPTKTA